MALGSFTLSVAFVAALIASRMATRRIAVPCRLVLAALFVAQICLLARVPLASAVNFRTLAALALLAGAAALFDALAFARVWLQRAREPLVLDPPFDGTWRVVAGGPLPGLNHHVVARDQYFAYDFVRVGRRSRGSRIVAPVAGTIVAANDGMDDRRPSLRADDPSVKGRELGNYVAIETGRGCVFLCHLEKGSVPIGVGDRVEPGDAVGRCGNSGRTTAPHLHVHAQAEPAYAFDRARGLPIAFRKRGEPKLLRAYSVLRGR